MNVFSEETDPMKFDRLSSENTKLVKGLSQNWVYSIIQDRYGYIWFGTWDGLNKYDGYNFTTYNVSAGLSDHTIYDIVEDTEGNLWLGTNNGLNKFDRKTQHFTYYENLRKDTLSLFGSRVLDLLLSKDGSLWLGTGGGLVKFDQKNEDFVNFLSTSQDYDSPRSNYILNICEDTEGMLWLGTTYGLVVFDPTTSRSTRYYTIPGDSTSLSNNNIRYILQENSGNFWIGTREGLNYYDTASRQIKQFFHEPDNPNSLASDYIRVIFMDRAENIWVGTEAGGLNMYNRENDQFLRFTNQLNNTNSLSNDKVYSIFEDASGNLWVGTFKGVNKNNKYINEFQHHEQLLAEEKGLNNNFIWSFAEDNDHYIYVATSNGVNIINKNTGEFSYLVNNPLDEGSLAANEVRTIIYSASENCLWIGLYGTGLDRYDLDDGKIMHYYPDPNKNGLSNEYINDLLEDKDGLIWIATGRGLSVLNPKTNQFRVYKNLPQNENSLSNDVVVSLYEDPDGFIWIGTYGGLNKFDKKNKQFTRFFNAANHPVGRHAIFYVTQDKTGKLWIGTSGGGIVKLDPETMDFTSYTEKDGLPNNIVYGILEDEMGNLWLSTNLGLVKFYTIGERFVNYDVKDGIQSFEFNLGSCYKDKYGNMYFGGMNGYNVFNPKDILINPNPPVVVISAFRKFNEVQPFELFNGDTIVLNHDDNFFSFEISALDYTNPYKNKYMYYLENVDNDWVKTDANNRIAEYKKVTPGTYTFKAKGSNNDGTWNEEGISIVVIINPAWYSTWWFKLALGLIIVAIIWLLIYRRIQQIKNRSEVERRVLEIEKQKFELEQKALRLQMNPHFIFNSLNSIQSYIVTHNTEMAVTYLGKFSQLMRLILTNSGNKFIPLKEELKSLTYYLDLEKLRFDNKFEYEIVLEKNLDQEFIEIPPMIIQPYVENAIIHGILYKETKGLITIGFELKEKIIKCIITDNGIGREKSRQVRESSGIVRKSSGMFITKARLEMLNQEINEQFDVKVTDLYDDRGTPSGTRVELNILFFED
ncbi:MAG: histidine kinase [Bacteroidales bacterium]|nr:histidine kinase [Bacteroidales bacterium]MCF8405411.1 histidine kinase [Bacteroidales bacterium]